MRTYHKSYHLKKRRFVIPITDRAVKGLFTVVLLILLVFSLNISVKALSVKKDISLTRPITEITKVPPSITPTLSLVPTVSKVSNKKKLLSTPTPTPTELRTGGPSSEIFISPSPQQSSEPLEVDKSNINVSIDRSNITAGLVFGPGFTITTKSATGWQIKYNQPTQGQGFYESSGGFDVSGKAVVRTYMNAVKPNGTYTGSAVLQYYKDDKWSDGPNLTYTITLTGGTSSTDSSSTNGTLSIDTSFISVTLKRTDQKDGLIMGQGLKITSKGALAWQIKYNEATQGQGFYESSGGLSPGSSTSIHTYINTNKSNGVYTGSGILQFNKNDKWNDGPLVSYSITLTD